MTAFIGHWQLACAAAMLPLWICSAAAPVGPDEPIPYVPTRQDVVRDLLWVAGVSTNDTVYDLGSGDGRILIAAVRDFHAHKAVGIELDPELVAKSREAVKAAGIADRVTIIHGDLFTNDVSEASVAVLYLGHGPNLRLRPKLLREMSPGSRIVAHQFGMGEWPPEKRLDVRTIYLGMFGRMHNPYQNNPFVPDYELNPDLSRQATIACWAVPARVAGVWRGEIKDGSHKRRLELQLHQTLKEVRGSFALETGYGTNVQGGVRADLSGRHLRFDSIGVSFGLLLFDGQANGSELKGHLEFGSGSNRERVSWMARREPCDFSGTLAWTNPVPGRAMELEIRRAGNLYRATLKDKGRVLPVDDFYDFGGGFYFSDMLEKIKVSPEAWGFAITPDTGWLIGEACCGANPRVLAGTLQFHPYESLREKLTGTGNAARDWQSAVEWKPIRR